MNSIFRSILSISSCVLLLATLSCSKDSVVDPTTTTGDLTPKTVDNLRAATANSFVYYSFDSDTTIATTLANTDQWDIRLPFLNETSRSVDVFVNSGNRNTVGKTVAALVDTTFDLITTAPADANLRSEDTTSGTSRIIPIDLTGGSLFIYNGAARTINPNPQKTLVLKTRSGKYVKVQFVNLYQGAVATPTMTTPLGYFRIRYVKSNTRQLK